jgi:hypothetical protein
MYVNLRKTALDCFGNDYWSSSESGGGDAWHQSFGNGGQDNGYYAYWHNNKNTTLFVRAIRAF